ncbi:MAG: oligosaccharide flippase family protein [Deferrisomatales bacterium]|nr:oligosaccharide flippase family protein [Deferrisomatales bacterium]
MSNAVGVLRSRVIGEGLWVSLGQGLTAIGLIVGIRLQTEFVPPDVFGTVALVVGISSLVMGVVCQPLAQGALRFLPDAVATLQPNRFRWLIWTLAARQVGVALLAVLLLGGLWSAFGSGRPLGILALCGLLVIDAARLIGMAFFNAMRWQRIYAGWAVAEAWGRPLAAVLLVIVFGASAEAVLSGYLLASFSSFLLFGVPPLLRARRGRVSEEPLSPTVIDTVYRYARPLMPLGIVGWVNTVSDRYLIAGILGVGQAGIYAAVYGLISRPFLMAQSTLELTLRPLYFEAVTAGDRRREWRLYRRWLALNVFAGFLLLGIFMGGSDWIVRHLLGARYSSSVTLIPYLAIGHVMLITAYNLNSYLYAHQHTKEMFFISSAGALVSVFLVASFAATWGLPGAAAACIAYFALQAGISAWFIWSRERRRDNR